MTRDPIISFILKCIRQLSQIDIDDRAMAMHEHNKIWKAISELEIAIRNIEEKETSASIK